MIKTENLTYSYVHDDDHTQRDALDKIALQIKEGEFVAVLGHNGSGKSTLAKMFNAVLLPEGGKVSVDTMDTTDEKLVYDIRQRVGMVFQNPDNQIVATIVEEDVAFGPENLGVEPSEIRQRVDDALKVVDMYDYKDHAPHLLSGGQKQRIAIAGIIAMRPKYIVLDEPTAMLDPIGRKEVLDTVKKLNRESGITIVLITHYMEEAVMADRVIVMQKGKVIMNDTPKKVFSRVEELKGVKLSVPQVTELAHVLSKKGISVKGDVITVDEFMDEIEAYL